MKPEVTYKGRIIQVVQFEGKSGVMFEKAVRAPGTRLIIETEKDGRKALLMTRERRYETGGYDIRLPGGKVFDTLDQFDAHRESGADIAPIAEAAARLEGREEAGIQGGDYTLLTISKAGATIEWDLFYYLVTGATIGEQGLEESEQGDIDVIILTAAELFEKLRAGEIQEHRSAAMIWQWLAQNGSIVLHA